jgi:hypothetical protein
MIAIKKAAKLNVFEAPSVIPLTKILNVYFYYHIIFKIKSID